MKGEIPEDVRRKKLTSEFTWLTNVGPEVYTQMETVQKDGLRLQEPVIARHELGRPKATDRYTEDELIAMGMAGLYRPNGPS
jgi:hypothetical protein